MFLLSGASPAQAAEVNVYTSREPQLIKPVLEAFTKASGVKVNAVFLQNGLEERVKAEGQNSPADVIVLVDAARLAGSADMGITQKVSSPELEKNVPANLRDPAGQWFATTLRSRVIYASKERVKQDAMTYEELADPKWKGRVCIRSGQHPYNVSLISAVVARHGEEQAAEWLKGVKANLAQEAVGRRPRGRARHPRRPLRHRRRQHLLHRPAAQRSRSRPASLGQRGEDPGFLLRRRRRARQHLRRGGGEACPNREEAMKLITFMTSDAAQALMADTNYEYPIRTGIPDSKTEKQFGPIKPDSLSLAADREEPQDRQRTRRQAPASTTETENEAGRPS